MKIRVEAPRDIPAVQALTEAAFAPMSFSDGTEAAALAGLRDAGDLRLSLVAEEAEVIIGHVAFSDVQLNGKACDWIGLGPISVTAEHQKQGIGTGLVQAGAAHFLAAGAAGFVLIGNPRVYGPMGFVSHTALTYRDLPTELVQFRAFTDATPHGALTFAPALE